MNLGIDLDEVLIDTLKEVLVYYNKKNKTSFRFNQFWTYHWWDIFNTSREENQKMWADFNKSDYFKKIKPLPGAISSMKSLSKENKIYIITSRPKTLERATKFIVKKHFGNIPHTLIFAGNKIHDKKFILKSEVCKKYNIHLMFEDQEAFSLDCAKQGIKTFLFTKPWNKKTKHKNIIRVKSWKEALNKIQNP